MNDSTKTIILGGTGTGEAPHMGMIAKLLSTGYKGDIVCLEVCRSSADFGYFETHKKLMERYSNYKYVGLATRDPNIKEKVYIQIGKEKISAIPEKDLDRTSAEGKASSVQFIHFNFSQEQIKKFKDINNEIIIGIDHKLYNHNAKISKETREALSEDFI